MELLNEATSMATSMEVNGSKRCSMDVGGINFPGIFH